MNQSMFSFHALTGFSLILPMHDTEYENTQAFAETARGHRCGWPQGVPQGVGGGPPTRAHGRRIMEFNCTTVPPRLLEGPRCTLLLVRERTQPRCTVSSFALSGFGVGLLKNPPHRVRRNTLPAANAATADRLVRRLGVA